MLKPYRILSMDGGGIRGIITIRLIERLEHEHPGFLSKIDLFAGTSTGGILALALAAGLTPTRIREMFQELGDKIFQAPLIDIEFLDLDKMIQAEYSNQPLYDIFVSQIGDITLGDLKKRVLISTFQLDNQKTTPNQPRTWKPKFFHNYPGPDSDAGQKVAEVVVRTSAAPTYFPVYQGYIDGGVVAANPSMCAVAQACEPSTGSQSLRDVILLSLSTGNNPHYLTTQDGNWGLLQWAPHLVSLMLEGSAGLADYQCRQLLGRHYRRVNPVLHRDIDMDSVKDLPYMLEIADLEDLTDATLWLKRYF